MSTPENVNYWIMTICNSGDETITRGFWEKFVTDIKNYCQGFNSLNRGRAIGILEDSHSLDIVYTVHHLNILFDVRTGLLEYWFISPAIRKFLPNEAGITRKGEIRLDTTSGSFKASSSPKINLGNGTLDSRAWPLHDRLAQYLLQKLVNPEITDARFESTS